MEQMITYMRGLDWSPLIISLKTGVVATAFSFFLGILAARKVVKGRIEDKSDRRWYSDTADGTYHRQSRAFFLLIDL